MRIGKNKQNRKTMQYFEINYGFRSPYKVILEESFIRCALDLNLPSAIDDLIRSAIQDDKAELLVTDCIRKRFEEFKEKNPQHFSYIESLRCVKCNHSESLSSIKCVMDLANKMGSSKEKYVICTQKDLYKQDIRRLPGIPLIYFNRSALTLDKPSKNSNHFVDDKVSGLLGLSDAEKLSIGMTPVKKLDRPINPLFDPLHRKKNPNPLSCKKKTRLAPLPKSEGEKKVRRSKKKKATVLSAPEAIVFWLCFLKK